MVVVNDDEISGLVDFGNLVGEKLIHLHVARPRGVGSGESGSGVEPEEIVEQWPECWSVSLARRIGELYDLLFLQKWS